MCTVTVSSAFLLFLYLLWRPLCSFPPFPFGNALLCGIIDGHQNLRSGVVPADVSSIARAFFSLLIIPFKEPF